MGCGKVGGGFLCLNMAFDATSIVRMNRKKWGETVADCGRDVSGGGSF